MIINFLQTRNPPVLPALHQRPHQKLPAKDGHESSFADDLEVLRGLGNKNKETLGELLFQFFRFYGHELDYDDDVSVVSVRTGKLISKKAKKWHLAINNRLCVEEPFNTMRNLANTADDTSFRGLHLELRRAFDLISEAKLEAACEEYIFPKQEEKIWEKPPPQPVPIISRSISQSRGGKTGNGNRQRHNTNHNRNGNGGRRASSGTSGFFDRHPGYLVPGVPGWTPSENWLQTQEAQRQLQNDFYNTMSALQAQENSLRMQLYSQSQAYAQAQAQAFAQVQRMQGNSGFTSQQATDRSRGSSFDNPPLTAPLRQDTYFYPLQFQMAPLHGQQTPSTYPSSPSGSPALPEPRRSLQRSTVDSGSKAGNGIASSSLRSQSQPASRTLLSPMPLQGLPNGMPNYTSYQPPRQIPNFMVADEYLDTGFDTESTGTLPESVQDDAIPKEYVGWRMDDTEGVNELPQPTTPPRKAIIPPIIPAFGDLAQRRRRLSTEQFPQAVIDRLSRQSRSPSPGNNQIQKSGTNSAPVATPSVQENLTSNNLRAFNERAPPIANGSGMAISSQIPSPPAIQSASYLSHDFFHDNPGDSFNLPQETTMTNSQQQIQQNSVGLGVTMYPTSEATQERDLNVNGVTSASSLKPQVVTTGEQKSNPLMTRRSPVFLGESNDTSRLSPEHPNHQQHNGAMSPLDIGPSRAETLRDDIPHLSPVYEARTPSPTANRKFENNMDGAHNGIASHVSTNKDPGMTIKLAPLNNAQKLPGGVSPKANGHTRASKSEGSSSGGGAWQKITKNKKKGQHFDQKINIEAAQSQEVPKPNVERKGG